jgi:signal transduction histidine kinase
MPRHIACLLAGLVLAGGSALQGADLPAAVPEVVLTNAQQVLQFDRAQLKTNRPAVRLNGVVVHSEGQSDFVSVQDDTGAVICLIPGGTNMPAQSQRVEITGQASLGAAAMIVAAETVRDLGPGTMPAPRPVSIADVNSLKYYGEYVELEGTVLQWCFHRTLFKVNLLGPTNAGVMTWTYFWPTNAVPKDWWGAQVRIRGVTFGPLERGLYCIGQDSITVVKPGVPDPFDAPLRTAAELKAEPPTADRFRLHATVLYARDRTAFLRDGDVAFHTDLLKPWDEFDPRGVYPPAVPIPSLRTGDVIELVASPTVTSPSLLARVSQARVLRRGEPTPPVSMALADVAGGRASYDLVHVDGRLVSHQVSRNAGGDWRDSMELEANGVRVPVTCDSASSNSFPALRVDDWVEVNGVVIPESGSQPARLLLLTPTEARSLGLAPALARAQLLRTLGLLAMVVATAGGWIAWLSHRLVRERQFATERARADVAVREMNVALERRVAERTSELERAKEDLHAALAQERELSELKSRFVALVSHEFRTPLGITMSAVELLRNYLDRLSDAKRRELLEDIYSSTLRMSGLMEQVLLLGRVESGKVGFQPAPLDLPVLCDKLVDEALSATSRKCSIALRVEGDLSGATGDENLLRHIATNLLTNAIKYSPAENEVEFTARRDGCDVLWQVRDHGIGIPEADRSRLFEAFHRGSNVGQTPGTGLGLLIVKRCVDLHGGSVEFESRVGAGTTFKVRLPVFAANPPPAKA